MIQSNTTSHLIPLPHTTSSRKDIHLAFSNTILSTLATNTPHLSNMSAPFLLSLSLSSFNLTKRLPCYMLAFPPATQRNLNTNNLTRNEPRQSIRTIMLPRSAFDRAVRIKTLMQNGMVAIPQRKYRESRNVIVHSPRSLRCKHFMPIFTSRNHMVRNIYALHLH